MQIQYKSLIGLAQILVCINFASAQYTNAPLPRFNYERFDAQSGALYRSKGEHDNFVNVVFVDSEDRVWVGTKRGLAIYDGNHWTNRTFKLRTLTSIIFRVTEDGADEIAEGPPGTIWLDGSYKVRNNSYEKIAAKTDETLLGTAVDTNGSLWVVTKTQVRKYDGKTWTIMLSPYTRKLSYKTGGLHGIVVEPNNRVWIGGRVHGNLSGPWEHDGEQWIANPEQLAQNPPAAALFMFDGKGWKAFGPQHGLTLRDDSWAIPELDGEGHLMVDTKQGFYSWNGETWKTVNKDRVLQGMRWVFGELDDTGKAQVLFRYQGELIPVKLLDHKTGEPLDLGYESWLIEPKCAAEDRIRNCLWVGTFDGLYRIWEEP